MAWLEKNLMYNNQNTEQQHHKGAPPMNMSPRISFSNDFVEHSHPHTHVRSYRDAPVSSDFEFSVSNYSMMSADELFFKGRLLPLKETASCSSSSRPTTTLRDELLQNNEEDENDDFSLRPPRNPTTTRTWRRGFLGLRKSHIGSKRSDEKRAAGHHDDNNTQCNTTKHPQEFGD